MPRLVRSRALRYLRQLVRMESLEERWVPALTVPAFSSLPGAAATIYLDFDGHYESSWGSYGAVTSPAYDIDGNPTSFSATELANIEKIWRYVAEDYAPFKINVTTVQPSSFANGVGLRVVIGGSSTWLGGSYGGVAYVNAFTSGSSNTVYVFPANLGNGNPKYVGDAASHEAGHAFGLNHKSTWSGTPIVAQYQKGPGDGTAPIMGNSYSATRSLWWYGTTNLSSTTYQNDMAVIASTTNGFGYRADDHGNDAASATIVTASTSGAFSRTGIIGQMTDADWFSFTTGAGSISLTADVPDPYNNLDAKLDLYDSNGNLIASANPTSSFDASLSLTVGAGTYYAVVTNAGMSSAATSTNYGFSVGQYSLIGSIVYVATPAPTAPPSPSDLGAAAVSSSAIDLAWTDNASNETGYRVERLSSGSWSEVAIVGANVTTYRHSGLSSSTQYTYRVRAYNGVGDSANSNEASATTQTAATTSKPAAASNLTAAKQSAGVMLNWSDNSNNESGFKVARLDGKGKWTRIATVGENVKTYTDTTAKAGVTYSYRIIAYNALGDAKASNTAQITVIAGSSFAGASAGSQSSASWNSPLVIPTSRRTPPPIATIGWANLNELASNLLRNRGLPSGHGHDDDHDHEHDDEHLEFNTNVVLSKPNSLDLFFASLI